MKAEIIMYQGYPALRVNGDILPPMAITTMSQDKDYLRSLGEAGIRLFFVICDTQWLKPDGVELLRTATAALLEAVPEAHIVLRVGLHPPMSWIEANPDELLTYNGDRHIPVRLLSESYCALLPGMYSLCSSKWREDGARALETFIDEVNALPCGPRVIGYFLAAGNTSEWYYPQNSVVREENLFGDHSQAFRLEFGKILRETYRTEEALRKAWHDKAASFDKPAIPGIEERNYTWIDGDVSSISPELDPSAKPGNGTHIGSFLDADRHQAVADFYAAWHEGIANSIVHFAKVVKQKTAGQLITGAFYGSYGCTNFLELGTAGSVLKILDSGAIDFLAAPGNYENRQPGGYTAQRVMQDSFRLRGRIFITEEDTRTHLASLSNRENAGTYTLQDSLDVMKRDFGRDLCEDLHAWWFDMAPQGGWYNHPDLLALIRRQQELAKKAYAADRRKQNQIALIYDQDSTRYVSQRTSYDLCHLFRSHEVQRIGAPVDYYFHDDLAFANMPDYRLYVFVNAFFLSEADRQAINAKVKRNGQVVLWMYAPGFLCPDRTPKLSVDHMQDLIGMRMAKTENAWSPRLRLTGVSHPAIAGVDPDRVYGYFDRPILCSWDSLAPKPATRLYPMFYPDDAQATVLGRFLSNGNPAMALREMEGWTSIYWGAKVVQSSVLRALAKFAGCHVYAESDDCLYANERFVSIHAKESGQRCIRFPRVCHPYEVYQRKSYGSGVSQIHVQMRMGETLTFHLDGEI